jgi:hypothetical protein
MNNITLWAGSSAALVELLPSGNKQYPNITGETIKLWMRPTGHPYSLLLFGNIQKPYGNTGMKLFMEP